jgi:hypothetical protein
MGVHECYSGSGVVQEFRSNTGLQGSSSSTKVQVYRCSTRVQCYRINGGVQLCRFITGVQCVHDHYRGTRVLQGYRGTGTKVKGQITWAFFSARRFPAAYRAPESITGSLPCDVTHLPPLSWINSGNERERMLKAMSGRLSSCWLSSLQLRSIAPHHPPGGGFFSFALRP